jgi:IS5 family transposase
MRQERIIQASLFDVFATHEIGRELKQISHWLDQHRPLLRLVSNDLRREGVRGTGRRGLPAEAVLRCALLKQYRQLSYEELAFHLEDSASFRAFARLPMGWTPKKAVLQKTISAITAASWEAINRAVVGNARQTRLEPATMVRIDSTVTQALMHEPTDSSLLWDAVRVMARLLKRSCVLAGAAATRWRDHRRSAKQHAHAIQHSRGKERKAKLYSALLAATRATKAALEQAFAPLAASANPAAAGWCREVSHYLPLIERVITQTQRRVFSGEAVPASEKVVSLFEPHADIIVKGGRDVQYGHKINLATGRSGLILDVVVEVGNPADAERFLPMLERHIAAHGQPPRQIASDGGYASAANLSQAKTLGVSDVAFHKKCRLDIKAMVKSRWVYRKLRDFRAGIEANISCLKRAFGLTRCTWRGLAHFTAYVWSSVVAYNLALCARMTLAKT